MEEQVGFEVSLQQRWALAAAQSGWVERLQVTRRFGVLPEPQEMAAALAAAVQRFEILRTTFVFPSTATVPFQVVHSSLDIPIRDVAVPESGSETLTAEEWEAPLDVTTGPLTRVMVLRDNDGSGTVVITAACAFRML